MGIWNKVSRSAFYVLEQNAAISYFLTASWQKQNKEVTEEDQVKLIRKAADMLFEMKYKFFYAIIAWTIFFNVPDNYKIVPFLAGVYCAFGTVRSIVRYLMAVYNSRKFMSDFNKLLDCFDKRAGEINIGADKLVEMADHCLMHEVRKLVRMNKGVCEDPRSEMKAMERNKILAIVNDHFDTFVTFGLIENAKFGYKPHCKRAEAELEAEAKLAA